MPNACAVCSAGHNKRATKSMSWKPRPVMIHSGKYSCAVAAFMMAGVMLVMSVNKTTLVAPLSLAFTINCGARRCASSDTLLASPPRS